MHNTEGDPAATLRKILIGGKECVDVFAMDGPSHGGASHVYEVRSAVVEAGKVPACLSNIKFQKGPVKEFGVNGCHNEDLIAIVIDRLRGFQKGNLACSKNTRAIELLQDALRFLNRRTEDRKARGVEGTNKP